MPYIYKEELTDEEQAAEVYTPEQYNSLIEERDSLNEAMETLNASIESLTAERDSLSNQLVEAKTKFADAFLAHPDPKEEAGEQEETYNKVDSFDDLFE